MLFTATGDSFITRTYPNYADPIFQEVSSLIKQADVRFTNLEVTLFDQESFPSAVSGGTWAVAPHDVLRDLKEYGFNLMAWANNHTLDYSYRGLEATKSYLDQYQITHAGVGMNLAEASKPKFLETPGGRVALIALTSTFHECWLAGNQRPDLKGRPGVNPLRYETTHVVTGDMLEHLQAIAAVIDINAEHNLAVKEGFMTKDNPQLFKFGTYNFAVGDKPGTITSPLAQDVRRLQLAIKEAERSADYVLVSIHAHEMQGEAKDQPAQFLKTIAREAIEMGAHAVIGHGPHILRGIEMYQNRPIFYSLGDFIFQNETVPFLPADFYEKYGLGYEHNLADALDKRSENNTKGLGVNPRVWQSVIPLWSMKDGQLEEISLYPIELGFGEPRYRRGWPRLSQNRAILEHLQELSKPLGTEIKIEGHLGKIYAQ